MTERKNHLEQEAHKELRKKKIADIEPILHSHVKVKTREALAQVVEGPLLAACQDLYDKNITSIMSSANRQNVEHGNPEVGFSFNYDGLSEENKRIAQKFIDSGAAEIYPAVSKHYSATLGFSFPVRKEATWGEVEDASRQIAGQFVKQRFMPEVFTPDWVMNYFRASIEEDIQGDSVGPEYFVDKGYYYDPISAMFFDSQEDLERAYQPMEGEDVTQPPKFSKVHDVN